MILSCRQQINIMSALLCCWIPGWSCYLPFIVILPGSRSPSAALTPCPGWELGCEALSHSTPRHILISVSPGTSTGNLSTTLHLWSAGFFSTFFFLFLLSIQPVIFSKAGTVSDCLDTQDLLQWDIDFWWGLHLLAVLQMIAANFERATFQHQGSAVIRTFGLYYKGK